MDQLLPLVVVVPLLTAAAVTAFGPLLRSRRRLLDLAAILAAAAERCVWGSDWPHTPRHEDQTGNAVAVPYRDLRYEEVVDGFLAALPSTATADMILDRNPAALYGFPHKG